MNPGSFAIGVTAGVALAAVVGPLWVVAMIGAARVYSSMTVMVPAVLLSVLAMLATPAAAAGWAARREGTAGHPWLGAAVGGVCGGVFTGMVLPLVDAMCTLPVAMRARSIPLTFPIDERIADLMDGYLLATLVLGLPPLGALTLWVAVGMGAIGARLAGVGARRAHGPERQLAAWCGLLVALGWAIAALPGLAVAAEMFESTMLTIDSMDQIGAAPTLGGSVRPTTWLAFVVVPCLVCALPPSILLGALPDGAARRGVLLGGAVVVVCGIGIGLGFSSVAALPLLIAFALGAMHLTRLRQRDTTAPCAAVMCTLVAAAMIWPAAGAFPHNIVAYNSAAIAHLGPLATHVPEYSWVGVVSDALSSGALASVASGAVALGLALLLSMGVRDGGLRRPLLSAVSGLLLTAVGAGIVYAWLVPWHALEVLSG